VDFWNLATAPGQHRSPGSTSVRVMFAQKAFVVSDDRLLMVHKRESDPYHPGLWEVPGGRMKAGGEDLDEHIRREVREETGIEIEAGPPFALWQWDLDLPGTGARDHVIAVARICTPVAGELTTMNQQPGDHLSEVRWVPIEHLHEYKLIPDLHPAMDDFLAAHARPGG
jgi:8-oxo-dGTP pyrophosphatase MutT (NUDIX family)